MNGGKLIGVGTDTCVFRPNLPCKNKKSSISNDKVSKVFLKKPKHLNKEIKMNEKISKIKNSDKWSVTLFSKCNTETYEKIREYEPDIDKCLEENDSDVYDSELMLYGDYGGISMSTRFDEIFATNNDVKNFKTFMKDCSSLFIGLNSLHSNKILHFDIKPGNITYNNNFKYIDFGLSTTFSNKATIEKRSLNEFDTDRLYIFYPYDLLYMYASTHNLYIERYSTERRNHNYVKNLNKTLFGRNIDIEKESIIINILNEKINKKNVIEKLDTYSLGITIVSLLLDRFGNKLPNLFKLKEILPFAKLLRNMTEMDSNNRISATDSYKIFNKLIMIH